MKSFKLKNFLAFMWLFWVVMFMVIAAIKIPTLGALIVGLIIAFAIILITGKALGVLQKEWDSIK